LSYFGNFGSFIVFTIGFIILFQLNCNSSPKNVLIAFFLAFKNNSEKRTLQLAWFKQVPQQDFYLQTIKKRFLSWVWFVLYAGTQSFAHSSYGLYLYCWTKENTSCLKALCTRSNEQHPTIVLIVKIGADSLRIYLQPHCPSWRGLLMELIYWLSVGFIKLFWAHLFEEPTSLWNLCAQGRHGLFGTTC
jgi:hypothetical protein